MQDLKLRGKKVLFFSPRFFGYEEKIKAVLESMGATVFFHSDRPSERTIVKALIRLVPRLVWPFSDFVFWRWIKENSPEKCDIVFIVKGEGMSPRIIRKLRERYPEANFIHYQWDSLENVKYSEMKLPLFDRVVSFDPDDCRRLPSIEYQPTFFCGDLASPSNMQANGALFFVGTLNGDRPRVLANIIRNVGKKFSIDYSLFVRSRVEFLLRKMFDRSFRLIDSRRLVFSSVPAQEISRRMDVCEGVIDIQNYKQSGLTLRTFDTLAAGKKLITTNRAITTHDFYHPCWVCVIDRDHPEIPEQFMSAPAPSLPDFFYKKYSLSGWIDRVLKLAD